MLRRVSLKFNFLMVTSRFYLHRPLQSFVCKLFNKNPAEDTRTLVPPLWENILIISCSRGCTRRNLCLHVEHCQHADQKQAHATIHLRSRHTINPPPTRFVSGKAKECRRRPPRYQVDSWSRGQRGCPRRSTLFSLTWQTVFFGHRIGIEIFVVCFLHTERDRDFCRRFSTHERPNVFVWAAWPAPATYHRPCCETPEGRSEPLTSASRAGFMMRSLLLSIDVCRALGISPLRFNIWLSISQADLALTSDQQLLFSFIFDFLIFCKDSCS